MKQKGTKNLTFTQRIQLETLLNEGVHKTVIAERLGVCLATVYNEIKRGYYQRKKIKYRNWFGDKTYKYVDSYSANIAHDRYLLNQTAHGAPIKLGDDYEFVEYIEKRVLKDKLSPCAVLGEIKRFKMFKTNISKTTLYRYIEQGVFLHLKMSDLPLYKRKKKYRKAVIKRAPRGTSIEKRPLEILNRNTFGNWEMDCVVGKKFSRDILLVLSERLTRYEIIVKMPNRKTDTVVKTLNKLERRFGRDFRKIFKSITVDNGVEFSDFKGLETSIYRGKRTSVYYCHPYTSCERGTNERLNREIRRHLPKGTDFTKYSDEQIQFVEDWVNTYPREIFDFATSAEKFAEQLALL